MNDKHKLVADWANITKEEYLDIRIDISNLCTIDVNAAICTLKYDNLNKDDICASSANAYEDTHESEIKELKQKLEEAEHANEIMRTNSKAMAEGLVRRDDKIKALEAEVAKLRAMIKYCKKNGVWAEMPILQIPSLNRVFPTLVIAQDNDDVEHLLDDLEMDDEDKN